MVITGIIIHLANDLPIMVDMEELPATTDRMVRCTNVRTVDGKRPPFVHDRHSTYILPLGMVRTIEVPNQNASPDRPEEETRTSYQTGSGPQPDVTEEESEEDLLARIRQI